MNYIKQFFYFLNLILFLFYLYPGSILGYILYGNFKTQPQITGDFVVSSNHVYVFFILSIIGFYVFKHKLKNIIIYLISISIILELFHLIIPKRSFQFGDLFGNLIGVILPVTFLVIYKYWRKK